MRISSAQESAGDAGTELSAVPLVSPPKQSPRCSPAPGAQINAWQCPTFTWGDPTLSSALSVFTTEFGMESGGSHSLWPPGKLASFPYRSTDRKQETTFGKLRCPDRLSRLRLAIPASANKAPGSHSSATPKLLGCYMVKPHGQLVPVSFTHYCASTPGLSTW